MACAYVQSLKPESKTGLYDTHRVMKYLVLVVAHFLRNLNCYSLVAYSYSFWLQENCERFAFLFVLFLSNNETNVSSRLKDEHEQLTRYKYLLLGRDCSGAT